MPFTTPLQVQFLDDRSEFPFITISPLVYECELTGETYTVPKHFRTDGASVPEALAAVPVVGQSLFLRYFGRGVFHGFKQGVVHDYCGAALILLYLLRLLTRFSGPRCTKLAIRLTYVKITTWLLRLSTHDVSRGFN